MAMFHEAGSPQLIVGGRGAGNCDNFIQMIERIENKTLVCGTNAGSPKCWILVNTSLQTSSQGQIFTMVGENVISSSPLQNAVTIAIDAEFEGVALFPHNDRRKDEIFFFYNEVNHSAGLDEELYKVWLGRVCKVDQGEKPASGDFWSTFLKARLVCGRPHEPLLFHRLEDAFVFREEGQAEATLYGVFSSPWGSSAVCSYSMKRISSHFEMSKFKDVSGSIPHPRPGMCAPPDSSSSLPKMLAFIKDHPELEDIVYPDEEHPLYVLQMNDTYTQVVVDKVRDANNGHLYASTEFEVTRLPLHDCSQYNGNCWKCILARDPYCGWDAAGKSCSAVSQENHTHRLIQSLDSSSTTQACKAAEEKLAQDAIKKVSVDHTAYIYLPCPLRSHHASYSWVKDNEVYPCAMEDQSCTLRFGQHTPMDEGLFKCMAREKGYKEEIMGFEVALSSGVIPELALMLSGAAFLTITILLL
ncbi:hypothetical protein L345_10464, partial [Ophiophagus hannah]